MTNLIAVKAEQISARLETKLSHTIKLRRLKKQDDFNIELIKLLGMINLAQSIWLRNYNKIKPFNSPFNGSKF